MVLTQTIPVNKHSLPFAQMHFVGKGAQKLLSRRVSKICVAVSMDLCRELVLYDLLHSGFSELGIIYGPGPGHRCKQAFPAEIRCCFATTRDAALAYTCEAFQQLVRELDFQYA